MAVITIGPHIIPSTLQSIVRTNILKGSGGVGGQGQGCVDVGR